MGSALVITGLAVVLSLIMMAAWVIADRTRQCGWVDAIWSLAIGCVGVIAALLPLPGEALEEAPGPRQFLVAAIVAAWSLRLGCHIAQRTFASEHEDPRYAHLRQEWAASFRSRLFWFLQIQAAAGVVLVLTIMIAAHRPGPGLRFQDGLACLILAVAVIGEMIADSQLASFRAKPSHESQVCNIGLWRFSRHPNYFFEWCAWLAYPVIAIDLHGAYDWGWLALGGPAFMYWLLVYVSGIPPLEAHMLRSRGDAFRDYQAHTNAFWPGRFHGQTNGNSSEAI
jgi:steroid 5-alpha reductase family enzyme